MFGYFLDITSQDVASSTAYTKQLFSDFWPFIAIVVGILIARLIISIFWKERGE